MTCKLGVTAPIDYSCLTQVPTGIADNAWLFNFDDVLRSSATKDAQLPNVIKLFDLVDTKNGYAITQWKKSHNNSSDLVTSENALDGFTNKYNFKAVSRNPTDSLNIDRMRKVIVVVETNEGRFEVYGWGCGMYRASDAQKAWDNDGTRMIEVGTIAGATEQYSKMFIEATPSEGQTVYEATKALLNSFLAA